MERHPIISNKGGEVAVKLVQNPLIIENMFPNYRYEFQNGQISEDAQHMYTELSDFIKTNEELVLNEPIMSREDYVKGFQRAMALTRLWIDSIYLKPDEQIGDENL